LDDRRSKRTQWVVSHLVLFVADLAGACVGMKPVNNKFTPKSLLAQWSGRKQE
jgi:hypothetical protein